MNKLIGIFCLFLVASCGDGGFKPLTNTTSNSTSNIPTPTPTSFPTPFPTASPTATPTPSPSPTTTPVTANFTVTNSGAASYLVNGVANAPITLQRGKTYVFNVNSSGHPFYIMSVQGTDTSNAYTNGVTGNGATSGILTFIVPANAPNTLFYDCSIHSIMTGTITITN